MRPSSRSSPRVTESPIFSPPRVTAVPSAIAAFRRSSTSAPAKATGCLLSGQTRISRSCGSMVTVASWVWGGSDTKLWKHPNAREGMREMKTARSPWIIAASILTACGVPAGVSESDLPAPGMAWVIFGNDTVHAEVAATPSARERGLMGRDSIPDRTGMLFVFPDREERLVWMKDTHIALDMAVFDERNRVVAIKQLDPLDESLTDSAAPTSLLLEVRQGWFAERGIVVGAVAEVVFGPGLQIS
ncbi:MAG: DUF192 domain-containing protein [Gemmatimonadetes bacterium]|nr:DUF192 domain-containing protein [Gemmatimonadota bacterium]